MTKTLHMGEDCFQGVIGPGAWLFPLVQFPGDAVNELLRGIFPQEEDVLLLRRGTWCRPRPLFSVVRLET